MRSSRAVSNPTTASRFDARPYLPARPDASIARLGRAAQECRGCDLYKNATQAVFGEGAVNARMMLVGEQPGDQEDRRGRPFVGPAGRVLDRALDEAKIDRAEVYLTNAVKHFKWKLAPRGKRRLHSKPSARQVAACLPWLEREISRIKPDVLVCLGATAAQALFGGRFRLGPARGKIIRDTEWAPAVIVTVHPSSVLRLPEHDDRERAFQGFLADLQMTHAALRSRPRAAIGASQ